jgi:hypothetical protein
VHYIYKPVGGNCFCVKELSLVYVEICYVYIFRTGYIYIYIYILLFCGDPFNIHLRAPPTPDDAVGREGSGCSGPQ